MQKVNKNSTDCKVMFRGTPKNYEVAASGLESALYTSNNEPFDIKITKKMPT